MWAYLRTAFFTTAAISVPYLAFAQESDGFFGPIVAQPGSQCFCPGSAPDWGCVLQTVQNVFNVAISVGIVICILWIAYTGFMLMTSGSNVSRRQLAKQQALKVVTGLVVLLSAWIIVDFVMKAVYNPDVVFEGTRFGPWNEIWAPKADGSDRCIVVREPTPIVSGVIDIITGTPSGGSSAVYNTGVGACNASKVQTAAASAGVNMSNSSANFLACIAQPESQCGTRNKNYNWGRGSSAYGPFQILLDSHAAKFERQACYQAAGLSSGPLNCGAAFRGGNPVPGMQVQVDRCMRAAANLACSSAVANDILSSQGEGAWVANKDSTSKHRQCAAQF